MRHAVTLRDSETMTSQGDDGGMKDLEAVVDQSDEEGSDVILQRPQHESAEWLREVVRISSKMPAINLTFLFT